MTARAPGPGGEQPTRLPEYFDDVDQLIRELPHPADQGVIRINRCLTCCCDTRREALMCLAERSRHA